ncbi:MAG: hypothetical protein ACYDET_01690 [Thermoleophilia bacterium]
MKPPLTPLRLLLKRAAIYIVLPLSVYAIFFAAFTYPAIREFSSHLYGDQQDGMINVWNIWHVSHALSNLRSPWFSSSLYYPTGTTLLGHTLDFSNSLFGALLLKLLPIFQVYNLLVIFAFLASGLSAFFLCHHFSRSIFPSLVGGFVYAFSGYQMLHLGAHANYIANVPATYSGSHLNLFSIQYMPPFFLFIHKFLTSLKKLWAVLAALFLIMISYTEINYFLFVSLASVLFVAAILYQQKNFKLLLRKDFLVPFALFAGISAVFIGPYLIAFLHQNQVNPFTGIHDAARFSIDLIGPFVPGFLKSWYGSRLMVGEGVGESFLGVTVWGLLIYLIAKRKSFKKQEFPLPFVLIFFVFLVLSLGPDLHVHNRNLGTFLPYAPLEKIIPGMSVSGVPARNMIMVVMAAAVIVSIALKKIMEAAKWRYLLLALITGALVLEYLPAQSFKPTVAQIDPYAIYLKDTPGNDAVFDDRDPYASLLDQIVDGRPVSQGLVSRIPKSVHDKSQALLKALQEGNYAELRDDGFRYLAVDRKVHIAGLDRVFKSQKTSLYDLWS